MYQYDSKETEIVKDSNEYYSLSEHKPFGAIVTDIDLSKIELSQPLIESIRTDIHKHQLLVFKKQAPNDNYIISPSKRVTIQKFCNF